MMMTGLATLMLVFTIALNYWNASNTSNIVLEDQFLSIKDDKIPYKDIKKLYVEPSYQKSRYTSSINLDTVNFAIMELKNGKTMVFSEENYDLRALFKAVNAKRK